MIDDDCPGFGGREHSGIAEHYFPHIVVVTDAAENDIFGASCFGRRRCRAPRVSGAPVAGPGRGAVENRYLVALTREMPGHGKTHDPESSKPNAHIRAQAAFLCDFFCVLRGSRPIERAMISRIISDVPAYMRDTRASV